MERDPDAARAEYMAEFRSDLELYINGRLASYEKPKHVDLHVQLPIFRGFLHLKLNQHLTANLLYFQRVY